MKVLVANGKRCPTCNSDRREVRIIKTDKGYEVTDSINCIDCGYEFSKRSLKPYAFLLIVIVAFICYMYLL